MKELKRALAGLGGVTLLLLLTPATPTLQVGSGLMKLAATSATELRQVDALVDRMVRTGELRVREMVADTQVPGRSHERMVQLYKGVPVFGAEVVRQSANGLTISVFGSLYTNIDIDVTAKLRGADVRALLAERPGGGTVLGRGPELMVLPNEDTNEYRLTYRARVMSSEGPRVYFVDANTGAVVDEYSDLQTQDVILPCSQCAVGEATGVFADRKKISVRTSGSLFRTQDDLRPARAIRTFDMAGNPVRTFRVAFDGAALFESDLASDSDNRWIEGGDLGATVDAHVGAGWTYDYWFKRFGRRGLDGNDGPIVSLVHPVRRVDLFTNLANLPRDLFNLFYFNAFYCGECGPDGIGVIVYGEGTPPGTLQGGLIVDYFAAGLDVVVHELTHGVTDHTSRLVYRNEPGALNEAFSDILAVGAEFFYQPAGNGIAMADYLIGEDVIRPGGIRSLADPRSYGDPDHFSIRFTGTADNGGVHTNSMIPGHAFYLAIEGGRNRVSGVSVQGVGSANREQIEKVFYRAFTVLMTSTARFTDARAGTVQAARDLYGTGSAVERAVIQAWTAVGVN